MSEIDFTHDPARRSWVLSANAEGCDFPIQNLPFTAFSRAGHATRIGVGIGDYVLDVAAIAAHLPAQAHAAAQACASPVLNTLMALPAHARQALRHALSHALAQGQDTAQMALRPALHAQREVRLHLPVAIGGFTDFFASIHHATNAGRLFRPDAPLLPNYRYVPVAYNGRANSVGCHDTVIRPSGQIKPSPDAAPVFAPSQRLDYEVELGIYVGLPSRRGQPVTVANAWDHVFGVALLNDWSARDIQAWEYQPLGPFLGKSFATSVAPWVVTAEALAPFRTPALTRQDSDPAPLPYLLDAEDQRSGGLDITLELQLQSAAMAEAGLPPMPLSRSHAAHLYWTVAQMVAHHTSNGSHLDTGDLLGSGTISGDSRESWGSLLELTRGGADPLTLPTGELRRFLEDGDRITLRGACAREGYARIGFGVCTARIVAREATP